MVEDQKFWGDVGISNCGTRDVHQSYKTDLFLDGNSRTLKQIGTKYIHFYFAFRYGNNHFSNTKLTKTNLRVESLNIFKLFKVF